MRARLLGRVLRIGAFERTRKTVQTQTLADARRAAQLGFYVSVHLRRVRMRVRGPHAGVHTERRRVSGAVEGTFWALGGTLCVALGGAFWGALGGAFWGALGGTFWGALRGTFW
eukprot:6177648-Pleurochrysis_carterae.AAC.1